jgi:hypothetical protein
VIEKPQRSFNLAMAPEYFKGKVVRAAFPRLKERQRSGFSGRDPPFYGLTIGRFNPHDVCSHSEHPPCEQRR